MWSRAKGEEVFGNERETCVLVRARHVGSFHRFLPSLGNNLMRHVQVTRLGFGMFLHVARMRARSSEERVADQVSERTHCTTSTGSSRSPKPQGA